MKNHIDQENYFITNEVMNIPTKALGFDFEMSCFIVKSRKSKFESLVVHKGDVTKFSERIVPLRLHSGCVTSEAYNSFTCDCMWQLQHAIKLIDEFGYGLVIHMPWQEGRGNGLFAKLQRHNLANFGYSQIEAAAILDQENDIRDYNPIIPILKRFGIKNVRIITNNPHKISTIKKAGFEVVEVISSIIKTDNPDLIKYLNVKKNQFKHLIEI